MKFTPITGRLHRVIVDCAVKVGKSSAVIAALNIKYTLIEVTNFVTPIRRPFTSCGTSAFCAEVVDAVVSGNIDVPYKEFKSPTRFSSRFPNKRIVAPVEIVSIWSLYIVGVSISPAGNVSTVPSVEDTSFAFPVLPPR